MSSSFSIAVDSALCIRCGRCVKVCPAQIFTHPDPALPIVVDHVHRCIGCGHCVDACPKDAVLHSDFPPEKVHRIDYKHLPAPEDLMLLMKSRRSNRALTQQPIPAEWLSRIVEAAHVAPTATNAQKVGITLITDPVLLRAVSDYTISVFSSLLRIVDFPPIRWILHRTRPDVIRYIPVFKSLRTRHAAGEDPILRHATALVLFHTPDGYRFGAEDCNLAYQNCSLMAEALGVSQIYMGFVLTALKQKGQKKLCNTLGINGHIHALMALGIPEFRFPNYAERKPLEGNA